MLFNATAVQYRTSINQHKLILSHSPGGGTTLETPCSPVSFGERFMKIRSAVPENGCLVFWRTEKCRKKTSVKHIRIRLIGGCVKQHSTHTVSLSKHSNIHFHTRARKHIRPALTDSMAATVAASVVQSRLDYANALLYGTLAGNIHKLQCAQNSLSRVVLPHHPGSASSRLTHLHWLPVHRRIQYKIALLNAITFDLM